MYDAIWVSMWVSCLLYTHCFLSGQSVYNLNNVSPNREQMQDEVLLLQAPVNIRIGVAIVGCTTIHFILCINKISIIPPRSTIFQVIYLWSNCIHKKPIPWYLDQGWLTTTGQIPDQNTKQPMRCKGKGIGPMTSSALRIKNDGPMKDPRTDRSVGDVECVCVCFCFFR